MRERLVEPLAAFRYPEGHRPSWWMCPDCKHLWHDAWQEDPEHCAWSVDAECGLHNHKMTQIDPVAAAGLYRAGYRAPGRRLRVIEEKPYTARTVGRQKDGPDA